MSLAYIYVLVVFDLLRLSGGTYKTDSSGIIIIGICHVAIRVRSLFAIRGVRAS